jgi:hypothetical protein
MKSDKPFSYLTSEQFLALPQDERAAYLQRVSDYLALRAELFTEQQEPEKS